MGVVIGGILPLALGIALGPMPVIAVILLLTGQGGKSKGFAYLIGWFVGLTLLVITVFLLVRGHDYSRGSSSSMLVSSLTLLGGIALLLSAYYLWRRRPPPNTPVELPSWLKTIHDVTPFVALGAGLFLGLVSVKNLIFAASAASAIGQANLPWTQAAIAVLLFIALSSLGVAAPVCVSFVKGAEADATLASWEHWLSVNNTTILCVLCLIIGVDLIGKGIGGLL